jgi:vacuolar-type H+-ATPase subunit H
MPEKSLLQSIREKELETNVSLDAARREAAELVEVAQREAAEMLARAGEEAARAAEDLVRGDLGRISREVEEVAGKERERITGLAESGRSHLPEAVEHITRAVVPD